MAVRITATGLLKELRKSGFATNTAEHSLHATIPHLPVSTVEDAAD